MSTDALSQIDIDRLLDPSAASAPSSKDAGAPVQLYDFFSPRRVSKERLRSLEAMYERLVKGLEGWLVARVRAQIEMTLNSVEQFTFGEFTLSLPRPCSSFIFDIAGTGQKGVIDLSAGIIKSSKIKEATEDVITSSNAVTRFKNQVHPE